MSFDEIPIRMLRLGVDRKWLATQCDYKLGSIASILAPNGNPKHKTDKALRRIWEALDREEARQAAEKAAAASPPVQLSERQQLVLRPTDAEYEAWSRAHARTVEDHPTLRDWAVASLNETAARIAALTNLRTPPGAEGKPRKNA